MVRKRLSDCKYYREKKDISIPPALPTDSERGVLTSSGLSAAVVKDTLPLLICESDARRRSAGLRGINKEVGRVGVVFASSVNNNDWDPPGCECDR